MDGVLPQYLRPVGSKNMFYFCTKEIRGRIIFAVAILLACVPCILVHLNTRVLPEDDAYIIFRYVDNVVAGKGMVYNEGERLFGVSTPLYFVWLLFLKIVFPFLATDTLAVRANLLWYLCSAAGIMFLIKKGTGSFLASFIATSIFLLHVIIMQMSIGGMESFMFISFVFTALGLAFSGYIASAFIVAGLGVLVRPEGLITAIVLLPLIPKNKFSNFLKAISIFLLPLGVWTCFALAYFGSPIPNSVIVKTYLYNLPKFHALNSILSEFQYMITYGWPPNAWTWITACLAGMLFPVCIIGIIHKGVSSRRYGLYIAFYFFILLSGYTVGNPLMCPWYMPMLHAMIIVIFVIGAWQAGSILGKYSRFGSLPSWICITMFVLIVARGWGYLLKADKEILSLGRERDGFVTRINGYKLAAQWLNTINGGKNLVAAPEVGALGYFYKGPILDTCGLVSRISRKYIPVPVSERLGPEYGAISKELIRTIKPTFIVTMEAFAVKSIFKDQWFTSNYGLVKEIPLERPFLQEHSVRVFGFKPEPDSHIQ